MRAIDCRNSHPLVQKELYFHTALQYRAARVSQSGRLKDYEAHVNRQYPQDAGITLVMCVQSSMKFYKAEGRQCSPAHSHHIKTNCNM